jgi:hypothetical protein
MVDHSTFETMEEMMDAVGDSIGLTADDYFEQAVEAYEYLDVPGGHIQTVGVSEPALYSTTEEELAGWDEDNHTCSYGIDASTTQERDFSNGLRVLIANAKVGVIGSGVQSLGDESTVVAGVFDRQEDTGLQTHQFKDTATIRAELRVLSENDPDRTHRLVKSITRSLAEGQHLARVCRGVRDADGDAARGPVFVDGPIYPPMVFPEVMSRYNSGVDGAWTDVFGETVGNYIEATTWSIQSGWPIVGIVKDMDSSSLITALRNKVNTIGADAVVLPWQKDKHFLTDLLQPDGPGTYVFTDWFAETARYSPSKNDAGDHYVEPFAGAPYCDAPVESYHRAFFYVRNPRTDTIIRVEAPRATVQDAESREFIQKRTLAEIAKTGESAEAIQRADEEARISRQNQQKLFRTLYGKMQAVKSYNQDYRGPEYLGESD